MPWKRIKNAISGNETEGMLDDKSKLDDTVLVLATAQCVLNDATHLAASRRLPIRHNSDITLDSLTPCREEILGARGLKKRRMCSRIGDQLRENALRVERDLLTRGNTMRIPSSTVTGTYQFTRTLHVYEHGEVVSIVGTLMGDATDPIIFNPEAPFVFEIFTVDPQRSLTDQVRILSQLVCLYSDAICFGGFTDRPLGDAIGLLRSAISQLRNEYAATSAYDTRDTKTIDHQSIPGRVIGVLT
ncbi:hypothetical protein [Corynebacterium silvaticum]|uniref:Uncharacterized protein n=1 Tax=Corynebacterium silvaticum TaxID=2320431 RepID=A0A7U5HKA0_9CORY|nr:hypothetical protein [Corynebacterium silvaticum]ARU45305.2 hypothetical protein CBE74_00895 [Corynebacterium silvaticum]MBH5301135.1 hypothetical protein [Corynebacterium silvaticum]NOM65335.1 hypothetical protein [Corynebacterium silvaticum]NON70973.1 hypothetical protein [Corynebacterium silvaticum]TFA92656.1 hypothetical protein EU802_04655 [Corynebacterium silvaticum]